VQVDGLIGLGDAAEALQEHAGDGFRFFAGEVELEFSAQVGQAAAALDELFAGTNSYDRYAGAVVLAEFLLGSDSSLAVLSTHDRNVTRWAEQGPERVTNVHFRDVFREGEMHFDYRLHQGAAMRGNAIELMKQAGMPMPESLPSPEA